MFHLFTHAFFKALLFLGAGSVIRAMHHEQDMRYYGALRKKIPLTYWAMMVGTLAITGVGIVDVFGFAGFYSKDAILEAAYASGPYGQMAFWVGLFVALLTSFYSWRLVFLTFFGEARWAGSEHIQHAMHDAHGQHDATASGTGGYHPHESPWSMLIALALLSVGAVFAGFVFHGAFVANGEGGAEFWQGSVAFSPHLLHAMHAVPWWIKWAPFAVMAAGLLIAWRNYIMRPDAPAKFVAMVPDLHRFLVHKWYFDEAYDLMFVRPAQAIGRLFWHRGDEQIIDRFGPNGAAAAIAGSSLTASRLQSGFVYSYAFVMLIGLAVLVTWAMVVYA